MTPANEPEKVYILLVHCNDQKGLVHKITGVLLNHHVNIVSNHEFVDNKDAQFFMRTSFSGRIDKTKIVEELNREVPNIIEVSLVDRKKKNIIVLVTKEHHCLGIFS